MRWHRRESAADHNVRRLDSVTRNVDASSFSARRIIAAVSHYVVVGDYLNVLCAPSIYRAAAVGHFFHRPGSRAGPNAFRADLHGSRIRITRAGRICLYGM